MDAQSSAPEFLTTEECLEIDRSLLPARDRFSARVAVYALRSLKQVAAQEGMAIAQLNAQQVGDWISTDPTLSPDNGFDGSFKGFFLQLVMASLRPLQAMATAFETPIEDLTIPQVLAWFEQEANARIAADASASTTDP